MCEFWLKSVAFLEHVILAKGMYIDPKKIMVTVNQSRPINIMEVRSFLGLAGYYLKFVEGFSTITASFTKLTKKRAKFEYTSKCEVGFQKLKEKLVSAPVLILLLGTKRFVIYNDASKSDLRYVSMQNRK